jgi:large subunit ribosomal protein L15
MEKIVKTRIKNSKAKPRNEKSNSSLNTSNLIPIPKNSRKDKKRIGQGPGSGMGKTSTRGQKGQKARASSMKRGFEGGQMPLKLRIPKRGFTNIFKEAYQPVNLGDIERYKLTGQITPEILETKGIIKSASSLIKILGTGEISSGIQITADACSASALGKIQSKGGSFTARKVEAKVSQS